MKKSSKFILIIIAIAAIAGLGVGGYFLTKPTQGTKEKTSQATTNQASANSSVSAESEKTSETNTTQDKSNASTSATEVEKVLYTYSSGDNAAAHGNGEILDIYEMSNDVIRFKYYAPWNTEDVSGTASKKSQDLYVYENGSYKIELLLNSMGENSIKVSEYTDGNLQSWKNLWTGDRKTSNDENTNKYTNVANVNGKYKDETKTKNYVHYANIEIKNASEEKIDFAISAAHGNDDDHVSTGEVSGTAKKVAVPEAEKVPNSIQFAYEFTEEIDGKTSKITIVYTQYKQFQYVNILEDYQDGRNPYAGNRVYFAGEYEKLN